MESHTVSLLGGEGRLRNKLAEEPELIRQYSLSFRKPVAHPYYSERYRTYRIYDAMKLDLIEQGVIDADGWRPKTLVELAGLSQSENQ